MVRFAQWWDEMAPADLFEQHPTSNLQVMTGRRWRLLVIDLDEPKAREWFFGRGRIVPTTWTTHSGGNGLHLWFRLAEGLEQSLPKAFLWKGDGKHEAVERLCDRSLIMAPPSIHPTTGERYRFSDKAHSPVKLPMPAMCPRWVLELSPLVAERPTVPITPLTDLRPLPPGVGRYRASDVVASIPDILSLVREWGVRLGRETSRDWVPCHAIDREDKTPSAAVHRRTGAYVDLGSGTKLGLFDLAVARGVSSDWREAVSALGDRFHAQTSEVA